MIALKRHKTRWRFILIAELLLSALLSSCVNDDLFISQIEDDNDNIRIRANVMPPEQTRAYYGSSQEPERVTSGLWYFTYPKASNLSFSNAIYERATVDFNASPDDPYTGFAKYINDKGEEKDLKWKHIWDNGTTSNSYYFYLHNINPDFYEDTYTADGSPARTRSYQKITFKDSSPFKAIMPLDKENGSNDIITGECSFWSSDKNKIFDFTLEHRLSLFKLNIEVYPAEDNHLVNLENATVTLNNIYTGLSSFSIYSPKSFSSSTSSSSNYYYGNYTKKDLFTIKGDPEKGEYNWESIEEDPDYTYEGETYRRKIYHSFEFVAPPQTFSGTMPKFTVMVPKEDVTGAETDKGSFVEYTGYLPSSMFNYVEGKLDPAPMATAFAGGYQLTVTASINSPETELHFSPVKVEAWISKGSFTISTNQAGIYNIDDFEKMVKAYNDEDLSELEKYGYTTSDGTFIIQFWNNLELPEFLSDGTPLDGCMPYKYDVFDANINFAFMFNGNIVKLLDERGDLIKELESSNGQLELYGIVSGETKNYTGIRNSQDLKNIIEVCGEDIMPDIHKLLQYGSVSNVDNEIVLDVCADFDIDFNEIFQKLPTSFAGYNVLFDFSNNSALTIVFNDSPSVKLKVDKNTNYNYFTRIAFKKENGIANTEDFLALKKFYNEYYLYCPDILTIFGTKNADKEEWTINLKNDITVKGVDFFYSMTPDVDKGKPEFSIYGRKSSTSSNYYTITVDDEYTPCSINSNSSYLLTMISGTGKSHGLSSANTIASNYNNVSFSNTNYFYNLWYYGRFDREKKKWIFPLYYSTSTHYATWTSVYGQMKIDESVGKYDYEFDFTGLTTEFEVQKAPKSPTDTSTETKKLTLDAQGEETLKHICLGDYWDWINE